MTPCDIDPFGNAKPHTLGRDKKRHSGSTQSKPRSLDRRKLDQLNAVISLDSLRIPPGNKLEALKGDRRGQYSIRINDQFRICFIWVFDGPERVEITDYH